MIDDNIANDPAENILPEEVEEWDTAADESVAVERGTDADADDDDGFEDDDLFNPAYLSPVEKQSLLTAILFTNGQVVDGEKLADYFDVDQDTLSVLIEEAAGEMRLKGLDIVNVAGGYKLVTASEWDAAISRFNRQVRKARLTKSALEILAVIAYEQPVARARIDELRQVNSESTVRSLLDKRLITVTGRADAPGRPFLYGTTQKFLEVFGLRELSDLPPRPANLDLPQGEQGFTLGGEEEPEAAGLDDLPNFDEDIPLED